MALMKTRYTVTTANGTSLPMTKARATKIARWLRQGKTGARQHAAPVDAKVVAV